MLCEDCQAVAMVSAGGLCGSCVETLRYLLEQNEERLESLWAWARRFA